jgi:hypothetical protein
MSADPTEDYDYLIYKNGANVQVKNGATGLTETGMTSTDASVPFAAVRDAMLDTGKVCKVKSGGVYPFNSTVVFDQALNHRYQSWMGNGGKWSLPQLKATGNFPVFELTGGGPITELENLYFTHNTVGYNKGLIYLRDNVSGVNIDGCRFYSFGNNTGDALRCEILTDLHQQYGIFMRDCQIYGMDAMVRFIANFAGTASNNFQNGMHFVGNSITNTKWIAKCEGVLNGAVSGHIFDRCEYQYIAGNEAPSGGAVFDFSNAGGTVSGQLRFTDCLIWDIPATINFLNTNASTEWSAKDCHPVSRIGGAGYIEGKGRRLGIYIYKEGTNTFSGDGLTKSFFMNHNMGILPRRIRIEATLADLSVIPAAVKRDGTLTSNNMVVIFSKPPPIGTNNITVNWSVEA